MDSLHARRAELRAELDRLDIEIAYQNSLAPERKLAVLLHDGFCHYNHTDQCSWHYEFDNSNRHMWDKATHDYYLNTARRVIDETNDDVGTDQVMIVVRSLIKNK